MRNSILSIRQGFHDGNVDFDIEAAEYVDGQSPHSSYATPEYVTSVSQPATLRRAGSEPNVSVQVNEWRNYGGIMMTNIIKHIYCVTQLLNKTTLILYGFLIIPHNFINKHFYFG